MTDTSRPVDRWDYDGDCELCFLAKRHTIKEHDEVLAKVEKKPRQSDDTSPELWRD